MFVSNEGFYSRSQKDKDLIKGLDVLIATAMQRHPMMGYYMILCIDDFYRKMNPLEIEAYLNRLLNFGEKLESQLEGACHYEVIDNSLLFFHTGVHINEEEMESYLKGVSEIESESSSIFGKIQCVAVTYKGELYNPDFGLATKMIQELDSRFSYKRLKVITDEDMRRTLLVKDLKTVVDRQELFLVYQPIVDVVDGKIVSLEALVRWNHPELGLIRPDEFIKLAEETNSIVSIDQWVIDEVMRIPRSYPIHINLSVQDLNDKAFVERLKVLLEIEKAAIVIELTETSNVDFSREVIDMFTSINAKISIDDFGTGYSSLKRLASMNVDSIKIDKSFVMNSSTNIESASLCIEIIRLGRALNIDVIAEGVETEEQMRFLFKNGCHLIQGYAISRPLDYTDVLNLNVEPFRMTAREKYEDRIINRTIETDYGRLMVLELSEDNSFIRVPLSFCILSGYSQQQLVTMKLLDLVSDSDKNYFKETYKRLEIDGHIENMVFYIQSATGEKKRVTITAKLGTKKDTTKYIYMEKNEFEEEKIVDIRGSKDAYSTLFHEGPIATMVWRKDFEIVEWNHQAQTTFGWSRSEAIGSNLIKLLFPRTRSGDPHDFLKTDAQIQSNNIIHTNITKTGNIILCSWANRDVKDSFGSTDYHLSIIYDVTKDVIQNNSTKSLRVHIDDRGAVILDTGIEARMPLDNELKEDSPELYSKRNYFRDYYENVCVTLMQGKTFEEAIELRNKEEFSFCLYNKSVPYRSDTETGVLYYDRQNVKADRRQDYVTKLDLDC